jgi:predicted phosphodiesterase
MRIAALYDIHANLPALDAVLADVRREQVDEVVIGGDVLPGPMPRESLDRLLALDLPVHFIRGNGEAAVLAVLDGRDPGKLPESALEVVRWTAAQLTPAHQRAIRAWPATVTVPVEGVGDVLFCHATPRNDTEIFTARTAEERVLPAFAGVTAPLVVCGHTHVPFDRRIGRFRVVNAGSVGMPFGPPGADWLLLSRAVELRHTEYDLAAAAAAVRASAYPQRDDFAANNILHPPAAESMLDLFAKAEMK